MILFSSITAAGLLAAAQPPAATDVAGPDGTSCVTVHRTGSILPKRVCHTAAEWSRIRATEQDICGPATSGAHGHCDVQLTSNGQQVTTRTRN